MLTSSSPNGYTCWPVQHSQIADVSFFFFPLVYLFPSSLPPWYQFVHHLDRAPPTNFLRTRPSFLFLYHFMNLGPSFPRHPPPGNSSSLNSFVPPPLRGKAVLFFPSVNLDENPPKLVVCPSVLPTRHRGYHGWWDPDTPAF